MQHVRIGAERAGRSASAVDIALYLRTAVSVQPGIAEQALARQPTDYIAVGVYRRMFEESGFAEDTAAVLRALPEGVAAAARSVSDRLLAAVTVVGTDAARRSRVEEYRRVGVTHPIVAPLAVGGSPFESWMGALDAFAP